MVAMLANPRTWIRSDGQSGFLKNWTFHQLQVGILVYCVTQLSLADAQSKDVFEGLLYTGAARVRLASTHYISSLLGSPLLWSFPASPAILLSQYDLMFVLGERSHAGAIFGQSWDVLGLLTKFSCGTI